MHSTQPLVDELQAARDELFAAIDRLEPGSLTTPGLVGEWSARELIAHVGYWAGHAVEVIQAAEEGRLGDFVPNAPPVDEVNATVARVARETDLPTVRKREAASFEALTERLKRMDPSLLPGVMADGTTVERGLREDGSDHYREHAAEVRRTAGGGHD